MSCASLQEFNLAQRLQAPERQLAALAGLRTAPGPGASHLLSAVRTCEGTDCPASPCAVTGKLASRQGQVIPTLPAPIVLARHLLMGDQTTNVADMFVVMSRLAAKQQALR